MMCHLLLTLFVLHLGAASNNAEPPGKLIGEPITANDRVYCAAFSPNGELLALGGGDHWSENRKQAQRSELVLWDAKTRKKVRSLVGHTNLVASVAFSPDGKLLASGSWDTTARLWDVATGKEVAVLKDSPGGAIEGVAFSPDGKTLAGIVGTSSPVLPDNAYSGVVILWDRTTHKLRAKLEGHGGPVKGIAFSPDAKTIAAAGGRWNETRGKFTNGEIKLWDPATGKLKETLTGHAYEIWAIAYSPDGRTLTTAAPLLREMVWDKEAENHDRGEIKHWDAKTNRGMRTTEIKGNPVAMAYSPSGKTIGISTFLGNGVRLFDTATMKPVGILPQTFESSWVVTFSPLGEFLAISEGNNKIQFWKVRQSK